MDGMERKKLAIIYLLRILEEESDEKHAFNVIKRMVKILIKVS